MGEVQGGQECVSDWARSSLLEQEACDGKEVCSGMQPCSVDVLFCVVTQGSDSALRFVLTGVDETKAAANQSGEQLRLLWQRSRVSWRGSSSGEWTMFMDGCLLC